MMFNFCSPETLGVSHPPELADKIRESIAQRREDCAAFEAMRLGALTKSESWGKHVYRCVQAVESAGLAPVSPDGLGWKYMESVYRLKCMRIAEAAK
jgi:hypothetical protein